MRFKHFFLYLIALVGLSAPAMLTAAKGPDTGPANGTSDNNPRINFREACDNAVAQIDMEINNVRARLTTGGDVWWDGTNGRYVVPKPPPGVPEVSSIFAGAVWLGGLDPGGGLKVAAQQYGRSRGNFDYYPGPLTDEGTTSKDTCANWDRFFTVSGESIREVRAAFEAGGGVPLDPSQIPADILGWPSTGNPFFFETNGFELPNTTQGLAGYWDQDLDGTYDPTNGDYPVIEIRGCTESPQFPEEMTFWIYNDNGDTHRESQTPNVIQMEIQVQAFAYTTADDINSMTFQRYKLINRAQEDILNTYFAMWTDADLGCSTDDFVGCDTVRELAYVYNEDALDGASGCTCDGGVNTYCDEIPILGIDYFRGPLKPDVDDDGNPVEIELGMSSFIYMNRQGAGPAPPQTTDPSTADQYYNYLQGRWLDGSPLWNTGDGFDETGAEQTRYAFYDAPNDADGWSMVSAELGFGDRRTLQASGPFTLLPGAVNELIIGVVWVPDQTYPAPSIQRLQQADDLAQSLFNSCFDICDGPDAPDVDIVELDQEVVLLLSNPTTSNNFEEAYEEGGLGIPTGFDSLYRFEGYRIFQFAGPEVSLAEIDDPNRVREIAQFDINNGITEVFNWNQIDEEDNPLLNPLLVPSLQTKGSDNGIRHSLRITEDAFASGTDTRLVNHRRYYFTVVAYGYNNYKEYDPFDQDNPGQRQQYKSSSRRIGDQETGNPYYQVIPRPITDRNLMANYGDGATVTRISGVGNSGNFLDLDADTRAEMEVAFASGETEFPEITYAPGAAPIDVFVANPREVKDGDYELTFVDDDMSDDDLDAPVRWMLRCLNDCGVGTIISERSIDVNNEQIIPEFGFSIRIGDVDEPGVNIGEGQVNGTIGATVTYADETQDPWLNALPDNFVIPGSGANIYNYVNTEFQARYAFKDPEMVFNDFAPGIYPYQLMDESNRPGGFPFLSPVWKNRTNSSAVIRQRMDNLTNIDIVFTSNKDLWSRCPVVETSTDFYDDAILDGRPVRPSDYPENFDTRDAPSVTKNADSDGLPEVDDDIDPLLERGMGWFPGYAVDVETGRRLAVFWGENSLYDGRSVGDASSYVAPANGADMIWNPSNEVITTPPGQVSIYNFVSGAQHYFYVTKLEYDEGVFLHSRLRPNNSTNRKVNAVREIIWAGFPLLSPGSSLLSYADGIIPNDVTVKLRVNNSYDFEEGTDDSNGYPTYRFSIDGKASVSDLDEAGQARQLEMINVVPNPYYGFSSYEDSQFETNVKITNLPARATVTIYSLDGKFIRKYDRDETPTMLRGSDRPIGSRQISPALEWDLKNFKGIPVSGGVYLIHVDAPGVGERTLKFFGVQRQFDPSGL